MEKGLKKLWCCLFFWMRGKKSKLLVFSIELLFSNNIFKLNMDNKFILAIFININIVLLAG